METNARHLLIGIFTLAVAAALVVFGLWAGKFSAGAKWHEYDVIFTEAVTGLSRGGPVQYNGIIVGEVSDLSLAADNPDQVIARIRVESDTPVSLDTKAKLSFTGLTGVSFIQLFGGSAQSKQLKAPKGRDVPYIVAEVSALQKLLAGGESLGLTINEILEQLRNILSEDNAKRLSQTIANLEALSTSVAAERGALAETLASARRSAEALEGVLARADSTMRTLDGSAPKILSKLESTLQRFDETAAATQSLVEENRAGIRSFTEQGLSQLGPALTELRNTLNEIGDLVDSIENDPSGFVLGRDKPEEYEP